MDVNKTFVEMDTVKAKQVVSPKNSPVLIEAEARNEGCEKGEKSYSIRLENNKFSLIHPVVSPCPSPDEEGVDGEGVQQRIYMIDEIYFSWKQKHWDKREKAANKGRRQKTDNDTTFPFCKGYRRKGDTRKS